MYGLTYALVQHIRRVAYLVGDRLVLARVARTVPGPRRRFVKREQETVHIGALAEDLIEPPLDELARSLLVDAEAVDLDWLLALSILIPAGSRSAGKLWVLLDEHGRILYLKRPEQRLPAVFVRRHYGRVYLSGDGVGYRTVLRGIEAQFGVVRVRIEVVYIVDLAALAEHQPLACDLAHGGCVDRDAPIRSDREDVVCIGRAGQQKKQERDRCGEHEKPGPELHPSIPLTIAW